MADHKDPRWNLVQGSFKRLANVLEQNGLTEEMSACWGVINFIDHDQESSDTTKRLRAIESAIDTLASHFENEQKYGPDYKNLDWTN